MATRDFYSETASNPMAANPAAAVSRRNETRRRKTGLQRTEQQLSALRLEFADVHRQLYEAAQQQRQLSGPRLLQRGDFEIASEIFPVLHLSGDFFCVRDLGATALLAFGDIAGKGLLAGMWFTHMLALTRTHGESAADPAEALAVMNRQMCFGGLEPPLTTMVMVRLDWSTGELLYCNAGHPTPILLRADGTRQCLTTGGPVLGAVAEARFESARIVLRPGDTLVGYSDGLLECRNENDEEFGVSRVMAEIRRAAGRSTTGMLFSIIGAAQDFAGTHAREDDCMLMVVRRN
jgi:serine phosphatase RsbU (regulator of sigma subunit)